MQYKRQVINEQEPETIILDDEFEQVSGGYSGPKYTVVNGQQYIDGRPAKFNGSYWY